MGRTPNISTFAAENWRGAPTAGSAAGSTTTGAATLGTNSVTLTNATWNSTLNGEQVYTCSGNCNVSVNAPINIAGFTNGRFNGNYTIIAQTATTFTVYSPSATTPAVTSESTTATMKVLACNILTMSANSVSTIETGGGNLLRHPLVRNHSPPFFPTPIYPSQHTRAIISRA